MDINVSYGASVAAAPAAFKSTINDAVQFLERHYSDPITVNIRVEYKAIGGLGQSSFSLSQYSYAQIVAAMRTNALTSDDQSAAASLPAADPISGAHQYYMTPALARALNLAGPSGGLDGTCTFTSRLGFDYDKRDGIADGKYDFFGTVMHEFTEVMGRIMLCGGGNNAQSGPRDGYYPLDLFHFSGTNERTFVGTHSGYFSVDNGKTRLSPFNTNANGDWGDWGAGAGRDSFLAFSNSGVVNPVSKTDIREMDILGYDRLGRAAANDAHSADHLAVDENGLAGYHVDGTFMHMNDVLPMGAGVFL